MADAARKLWTVEEFLAWDDGTDQRYELVGGVVLSMAPASPSHGILVGNADRLIGTRLHSPCTTVVEAGVRLPGDQRSYFQADLVVTCTPQIDPQQTLEPVVVIEVLSPSTATHDRGAKLYGYRSILSVREIMLISSAARHVELWRRLSEGWSVQDYVGDAIVRLDSIGVEIALTGLYANVVLERENPTIGRDH